ncbi:hypothetical protein LRP88_02433 [Fusarium phalaenopsidis]|nr:hypothetical protein NCS56_00768900 [Fusarium sp. Ph1]
MHFTTLIAATAALASTATASFLPPDAMEMLKRTMVPNHVSAKVVAVNGFGKDQTKHTILVPLGRLTHVSRTQITELRVEGVDHVAEAPKPAEDNIVCQRYLNQYASKIGSERFTKKEPAHISTNPVDFGWILCYVTNEQWNSEL